MALKRWLLLIALVLAAPSFAGEDDALRRLQARLGPLKSMQAKFSQTVLDEQGKPLQTSEGTLAVKRGNRLRWETTSPFSYLIVTDGKTLWRYDRDLEQANRQPFSGELADTPALIFSGDVERIGQYYRVSFEQGSAGEWYELAPRQEQALFRSLRLLFADGGVSQLVLRDNLDQRTEIQFHSMVANPTLLDSLFQFRPPAGVDVVVDEP
jgi:outer membrane lipoprotein carrier protein